MSQGGAIHDAAAVGFGRAGADYELGRPGYPASAVRALAGALELAPGSRVIDLAAGTGKLTRELTRFGATVVAVEPVAAMREQLMRLVPEADARAGTAERMALADHSADAVTVAQAFHWFDAPRACAEIHRVLRPGGGLGVIWNSWDESVEWVARLQERVHRHVAGTPQQRSSRWREELDTCGLFTPSGEQSFRHVVRGGLDALLARVASVSYIASLAPEERAAVLADVRRIAAETPALAGQETFEMPYTTRVLTARARP